VRTYTQAEGQITDIVAASVSNQVYTYSGDQKAPAWSYETRDHIRAICLKDINDDGQFEALIGSEDRNLQVLDHRGNLLWRYFFPHSVLCIDAIDIDHDKKCEIFVGCADGFLYVLNSEGEYMWKYRADDRIHAVRVADIDMDGSFEIALGSEDELELLRLVNQQELQTLVDQCWSAILEQQSLELSLHELLFQAPSDPYLQAFALSKLLQLPSFSADDLSVLESMAKDGAFEARHSIAALLASFGYNKVAADKASHILYQLSIDPEQDVRSTVVEHIPEFIRQDWKSGFSYLERYSENDNRHIRRLVMLKLHQVIDMQQVKLTSERQHAIFDLLLVGLLDPESEWVHQEAARTLAHFLDLYPGRLIVNTQVLIVKQVNIKIFRRIAQCATTLFVKDYLNAVIKVLEGVTDENALERVQQVVNALEGGASGLSYSRDLRTLYDELRYVLTLLSIEAIAQYQCMLNESQFDAHNEFAPIMLATFKELSTITRTLRIYLRREGVQDRLNSLLNATKAIEKMEQFLEKQYSNKLMGISIENLPDRFVFKLLLARWQRLVNEQINELRGKAKIEARLQENQARFDDVVAIWLHVCNAGNSSADELKITLLDGSGFTAIGRKTAERETLIPDDDATFEFILKPEKSLLDLHFEIVYSDGENAQKIEEVTDQLELSESYRDYAYVANPYSTGTPMHDREMFYGREKDMAYLQDNLTRKPKTVIVLFGQRRSGKTTVLLQLIKNNAFGENVPVLIDLQAVSYNMSIQSFLYRVATNFIYKAMKERNLAVCEPKLEDYQHDPMMAFDRFLDSVEERLEGRKLIWLVDEFEVLEDQVDKGKLEPEIFQYLRNIVQHRQSINILFSGTHQITEYTRLYHSVFFNIADHYRLSKISPEGAVLLITKPVEGYLEYEPLAVTKIRQFANDQPYLIHLLCRAIVDYCNENRKPYVTINDVNVVLGKVMSNGQYHFSWLWDQVGTEEHMVLSTLAHGGKEDGRWLTLFEISEIYQEHHIPFKRHYVLDALKTLIDADVVESISSDSREAALDNHKFRVPVGLTRRWLLREHPLEMAKAGLSE
ncbi:MAG TPA: ATP-binding protein, partial [Ktedonobacteraceae bacterium]|nr:ATP-binding protein [Ktedonobacteraceae bacterium]